MIIVLAMTVLVSLLKKEKGKTRNKCTVKLEFVVAEIYLPWLNKLKLCYVKIHKISIMFGPVLQRSHILG